MTAGSDVILQRMMSLHPKIIDLTLDRVWRLLHALGDPQDGLPPVVHVAGTNGKGSTVAMVRAGLEAMGKTCHAYTSPHLVRFHERIRLAGTLIDEDALSAALDECEAANGGAPITYFEITTCAALLAMARTPADYTLLEVGLGGRLDATNVIAKPAVTAITPVSMDHEAFLGDTLAKIAAEKAGILKRGVPAVIARQAPEAEDVIEAQAQRVGAPLQSFGQHWHVGEDHGRLVYQDETGLLDLPRPALRGQHQIENAGTAMAILRTLGATDTGFEGAMTGAEWPARVQRLRRGPLIDTAPNAEVWLDGGHNPAAGQALADHFSAGGPRPLFLVCGMLRTKDVRGFLRPLANQAQHLFAVSIDGEAATLSADETAQAAQDLGLSATAENSVADAVSAIVARDPNARILICGSLYLAGQVLRENH